MIKKIILSLILYLFIANCGFTPLYSAKGLNDINIEVLSYEGDREINLNLVSKLTALKANVNPGGKLYKVKILTDYKKTTLSNNLAGEAEEYQLQSTVKFTVIEKNSKREFNLNEKFVMKNLNDDFEERNYETNIKNNMTNLIYNKFLLQIKKLK
tara:strand:+ start:688 stop:1152 length:465 start_codon:yes stop_codon:yes gene_type:complete